MRRFVFDLDRPLREILDDSYDTLPRKWRSHLRDRKRVNLGRLNSHLDLLPNKLLIKNGEVELEALIERTEILELPGYYSYSLIYDGPEKACYTNTLKPFRVLFYNSFTGEINGDSYVANFHKTYTYSGTQVITTILKFLKILGSNNVELYDASSTDDTFSVSLSLIKLIELGRTFYAKFGFEHTYLYNQLMRFGTRDNQKSVLKEAFSEMKNITLKEVLKYHYRLIKILCEINYNESAEELGPESSLGKDIIKYYISTNEPTLKREEGITFESSLLMLRNSAKLITRVFQKADTYKPEETLHDIVAKAIEKKDTEFLDALLSLDHLPLSIKFKDRRKSLVGTYLRYLSIIKVFSTGILKLDLRKIKL